MSSTTIVKTVSATEIDNELMSRGRATEDFLKATSAISENLKGKIGTNILDK